MKTRNKGIKKSERIGRYEKLYYYFNFIAGIVSVFVGIVGSVISASSVVGIKKLTPQLLIIFVSIFAGIIIVASVIRRVRKASETTRKLCRTVGKSYISKLEASLINPVQK